MLEEHFHSDNWRLDRDFDDSWDMDHVTVYLPGIVTYFPGTDNDLRDWYESEIANVFGG